MLREIKEHARGALFEYDSNENIIAKEAKKKKRAAARETSAADANEARISFVIKAEHWRGELVLAATHVDLREMLRAGEDKVAAALSLRDINGQQVAQLDVRLLALKTLRAAWWLGARREHFSVGMHGLRLNAVGNRHRNRIILRRRAQEATSHSRRA